MYKICTACSPCTPHAAEPAFKSCFAQQHRHQESPINTPAQLNLHSVTATHKLSAPTPPRPALSHGAKEEGHRQEGGRTAAASSRQQARSSGRQADAHALARTRRTQEAKKDGAGVPTGDIEGASAEELNQKITTLEKEKNKEEEYRNYMQLERVRRRRRRRRRWRLHKWRACMRKPSASPRMHPVRRPHVAWAY